MKKISIFALVGAMACLAAHAEFQGPAVPEVVETESESVLIAAAPAPGGFVSNNDTVIDVAQVRDLGDNVDVVLQGRIIQKAGDDKYLFEDSTGSITLEIDKGDWGGQTITPNDTVRIYGETDRGIFKTEIDVDYIQKM